MLSEGNVHDKPIDAEMINKSPAFRETRSSLLCSQEPLAWPNLNQKDAFHTSDTT
jgi:hypothetical protein